MNEIEVPLGFVFYTFDDEREKMQYHIVLDIRRELSTGKRKCCYITGVHYIDPEGVLEIAPIVMEHDSEIFFELFKHKELLLIDPVQFDAFKQFYELTDFRESELYAYYPPSHQLLRSFPGLEELM
jgi:hypothetical protein